MTARSKWRGHEIEVPPGAFRKFVFSDIGEPTAGSNRPCGHCHKHQTVEGHDACLGTLPGVRNACCGHGEVADAYVQLMIGKHVQGADAVKLIEQLRKEGRNNE